MAPSPVLQAQAEVASNSKLPPDADSNANREKRVRQLRKKLLQISRLKEKDEDLLDADALQKIASEPGLLEELAALERGSHDAGTPVPASSPQHSPSKPCSSPPCSPSLRGRCYSTMSTKSWFDDAEAAVAIEDLGPPDPLVLEAASEAGEDLQEEPQILADLKPHTKEVRDDPATASLVEQTRVLSNECFEENCLDGCSKRGGWRITLLVSGLNAGADARLLGFIVFRLKPALGCVSVAKIAVPEVYRRRGYGRRLVQWVIDFTKGLSEINCVGLAALPEAVPFYRRLGFKSSHEITAKDCEEDEDLFPGQIYMELKWKIRKARTAARCR
eukprot:gnl/TRDRNA2_/TRDRNA2_34026_c0_seq1.p1 gnl/TRDRNA2_/TRDRNA2_34026_c0~~gnl/TRDRNA2_/TRDRNA2_34026_c0_seq1.p1  ORF type:complete len:331 (+),score=62.77 gnl/TRDRNA2_/TRDRNA2_34026_c0_seq1:56-1048(+)